MIHVVTPRVKSQIEPDRSTEARGTIAYDRLGEEMRITEERFESNSTREFYDTFYLYGQVKTHANFQVCDIVQQHLQLQ